MIKGSRPGLDLHLGTVCQAAPSLVCGQAGPKADKFSQHVLVTLRLERTPKIQYLYPQAVPFLACLRRSSFPTERHTSEFWNYLQLNLHMLFPALCSLLCSPKLLPSRSADPENFLLSSSGRDCKDTHFWVGGVAYCMEPLPSMHNTIHGYSSAWYKAARSLRF